MDMKKIICYSLLSVLLFAGSGCSDYLDVVPDKTQEISLLFDRRESAYKALATCYNFIPIYDNTYAYVNLSDETIMPYSRLVPGKYFMIGWEGPGSVNCGFWHDINDWTGQGKSAWKGIRCCNTFLDNIMTVMDMDMKEKRTWMAEVNFLKAYYHFLLFSQYGPIPIIDSNVDIDASNDAIRSKREPVDVVVQYIVDKLDEAIADLPEHITSRTDLGRIDKLIAQSLKSRVLLYAASPLFNGNTTYYEKFVNIDGEKMFNTTYDANKWKLAADAALEAIKMAESNSVSMFYFSSYNTVPEFDQNVIEEPEVQALYNYRYMFTDKWNTEMIWGESRIATNWWDMQRGTQVKNPSGNSGDAWQWLVPTLKAVEAYYTENGLPLNEDLTFDYANRYQTATIGEKDALHATAGEVTAKLHLGREPRFYASIAFDRGINRTYGEKWSMRIRGGEPHGRSNAASADNSITGYFLKKTIHPDSKGQASQMVHYPWPLIRLAELYLNYAEALNEFSGPSQEVYDALNMVRRRANIPDVETVWSDATLARNPNKHKDQAGLRQIIQQERRIELAFECHRNNDVRRWLKGEEFDFEVKGWSVDGTSAETFYNLMNHSNLRHIFIAPRDYLWPILNNELTANPKLVQNPGY